jgi:hypothetical protein
MLFTENFSGHGRFVELRFWRTAFVQAKTNKAGVSRAQLKRVLSTGNRLALVISLWALFWPRPYFPVIALCFVLPMLAVAAEVRFSGLVDLEAKKRRNPLSVAAMAIAPALVLCVRALEDLNVPDWRMLVAWSLILATAIVAGICAIDAHVRRLAQLIPVIFLASAYSFGTLALANVFLDPYRSSETPTTIMAKRIRTSGGAKGSSTWHEVRVEPSAAPEGAVWIHVRQDVYSELQRGDTVCVHSGRGLFTVRWFDVRLCSATFAH